MRNVSGIRALIPGYMLMLFAILLGCSSGGNLSPTIPGDETILLTEAHEMDSDQAGHQLWGFWQVTINTTNGDIEVLPLREGTQHLNVIGFLEPPVLTSIDLDWDTLIVDIPNNYLEVVVKLRHPFPGAEEFSAFDVKGILISDGSVQLHDGSEIFSGPDEPRLVNADGLTRWWNPSEFLGTDMYGYTPGLLGTPGGAGVFGATLNGYKYFCIGLEAGAGLETIDPSTRGHFPAGQTLKRLYQISFGSNPADFLVFNYAIDASWEPPVTIPPSIPDDFPLKANSPEPYWIETEVLINGLYYDEVSGESGGKFEMNITVHDWQGAGTVGAAFLDNASIFEQPIYCTPLQITDPNEKSYHVSTTLTGNIASSGPNDVIIKVYSNEGTYQQEGKVPFFGPGGSLLTAYQRVSIDISNTTVYYMKKELEALLLPPVPFTTDKDFSVIGSPGEAGVYYFGSNYEMYRYPLDYSFNGELHNRFIGFLNWGPNDLWGYPIMLSKLDMTQAGEFSMFSDSTDAGFIPPYLIRDFAYQFDSENDPLEKSATQGISPGYFTGVMKVVDISATTNFDDTDVVFWIYVDDELEDSEPAPGVTVPLLYFRYPYGPDIYDGDIGAVSGSPIPLGTGEGKVLADKLVAFAVIGDPFTAGMGETDIICGYLEAEVNELELFAINTNDVSDVSNVHLTTITAFLGSPVDIEMLPAFDAGMDATNDWIAVLEQGQANESILEVFSNNGQKLLTSDTLAGQPVAMDVDPYSMKIHVWFQDTDDPNQPVRAAVFSIES